jgi:hypothetical protein
MPNTLESQLPRVEHLCPRELADDCPPEGLFIAVAECPSLARADPGPVGTVISRGETFTG